MWYHVIPQPRQQLTPRWPLYNPRQINKLWESLSYLEHSQGEKHSTLLKPSWSFSIFLPEQILPTILYARIPFTDNKLLIARHILPKLQHPQGERTPIFLIHWQQQRTMIWKSPQLCNLQTVRPDHTPLPKKQKPINPAHRKTISVIPSKILTA